MNVECDGLRIRSRVSSLVVPVATQPGRSAFWAPTNFEPPTTSHVVTATKFGPQLQPPANFRTKRAYGSRFVPNLGHLASKPGPA